MGKPNSKFDFTKRSNWINGGYKENRDQNEGLNINKIFMKPFIITLFVMLCYCLSAHLCFTQNSDSNHLNNNNLSHDEIYDRLNNTKTYNNVLFLGMFNTQQDAEMYQRQNRINDRFLKKSNYERSVIQEIHNKTIQSWSQDNTYWDINLDMLVDIKLKQLDNKIFLISLS
jgi:hypothetical protein